MKRRYRRHYVGVPGKNAAATRGARQGGHIMVYAVSMLLTLALTLFLLFNTGQLTSEKIRLTNTSDAVAYSLATVEARDFNFLAYTNRAIIANHASIAQTMALANFVNAVDVTAHGTEVELISALHVISVGAAAAAILLLQPELIAVSETIEAEIIPAVAKVFKPIQQITRVLTALVAPLAKLLAAASGAMEKALYGAQVTMQASMVDALGETYAQVKSANDPDANYILASTAVSVTESAAQSLAFLNLYKKPSNSQDVGGSSSQQTSEGKKYGRFTKMIEDNRDDFTKRRTVFPFLQDDNNVIGSLLSFSKYLPISLTPKYAGGTDFGYLKDPGGNTYGWQAVDAFTLELNVLWGLISVDTPIGGASFMQTASDSKTNFTEELAKPEAIRYGGQKAKDAVTAWWKRRPEVITDELEEEKTGAMVEAFDVSSFSLAGVFSDICLPVPNLCDTKLGLDKEFYVLNSSDPLPSHYFDLRTTEQLKEYGVKNEKAVDLVDRMDSLHDPDPNSDLGPSFVIPLIKKAADIRTAKQMGMGAERAEMNDDGFINGGISTLSKGQVYFHRPADRWLRKDLVIEHRSLFNPYWQAHLVQPTVTERLAYLATWGLGGGW